VEKTEFTEKENIEQKQPLSKALKGQILEGPNND
jgi:hypothetical protein